MVFGHHGHWVCPLAGKLCLQKSSAGCSSWRRKDSSNGVQLQFLLGDDSSSTNSVMRQAILAQGQCDGPCLNRRRSGPKRHRQQLLGCVREVDASTSICTAVQRASQAFHVPGPCFRGFAVANTVLVIGLTLLSSVAVFVAMPGHVDVNVEEASAEDAGAASQMPYFVAAFVFGALLNCRELLSLPLV
eukprot:CAMPEP_0172684660 /NCGR_PEP_ID=MMETSP1074-20121228/19720_1 /TAXON_ID=2916 /ORGANISM="Ceratium fusus, Strain PA161109" /LENGTH=187 /DNA_ID=CAMNT_0013503709 /DNA_START=26 /DNA_END=589 /DNA_ORIENTATION=-